MSKSTINITSLFSVFFIFTSCGRYCYKAIYTKDADIEVFSSNNGPSSTYTSSSIDYYQNNDKPTKSESHSISKTTSQNGHSNVMDKHCVSINRIIIRQSIIQKRNDGEIADKQVQKKKGTVLYDNLSLLSTAIGIFSFLISFIVPSMSMLFGILTITLGSIGIIGNYKNISTRSKKPFRLAILGIFLGILSIVVGQTLYLFI